MTKKTSKTGGKPAQKKAEAQAAPATPTTAKPKRVRRTMAQMAQDLKAKATALEEQAKARERRQQPGVRDVLAATKSLAAAVEHFESVRPAPPFLGTLRSAHVALVDVSGAI